MLRKVSSLLVAACLCIPALAQQTSQSTVRLTSSGQTVTFDNNIQGATSATITYAFAGGPTSVTMIFQGVTTGGLPVTLNTYTSPSNGSKTVSLSATYSYFQVVGNWSGGFNVTASATLLITGAGPSPIIPAVTANAILGTATSPSSCTYSASAPSIIAYNGNLYLGGVGNTCIMIGGGGGGSPGGLLGQVQFYYNSTTFGGSAQLYNDSTAGLAAVATSASLPALTIYPATSQSAPTFVVCSAGYVQGTACSSGNQKFGIYSGGTFFWNGSTMTVNPSGATAQGKLVINGGSTSTTGADILLEDSTGTYVNHIYGDPTASGVACLNTTYISGACSTANTFMLQGTALAIGQTPLTTSQDILYQNSSGALARLPISTVTSGQCLGNTSGAWASIACGTGSGTVTSFSAGNLSPLFNASVATATTTPALTFALINQTAGQFYGNCTTSTEAPNFNQLLPAGGIPNGDFVIASVTAGCTSLADGGSGITLNGIQNPTGNWAPNIGSNIIQLNFTSAVAEALTLQNSTAAVVGTSQGSPQLGTCGNGFHGSASVPVCIWFSVLPGNGNDAAIAVTAGSTTTSTGAVTWTFPKLTLTTALSIANGGTGSTTQGAAAIAVLPAASEVGDIVYCSAYSSGCTTWSILAGNASGTQYLTENSSGTPAWHAAPFYMLYAGLSSGLAQATTGYVMGTPGATPSTYAAADTPLPNGGTLSNLQCKSTAAPGGTTQTIIYTIYYAAQGTTTGSSSNITCTESTGGNNYCSDTSHTLALTAGETVVVQMVTSSTSGTIAAPFCSFEVTNY